VRALTLARKAFVTDILEITADTPLERFIVEMRRIEQLRHGRQETVVGPVEIVREPDGCRSY
jgi:hypothetical protein